jgi:subtilisin family serine protease
VNKYGTVQSFGGTSCANPNMAGIASLVWAVNPNLDGADVRNVMTSTAMDLGAAGRDDTYGRGLVNADAAVRRAWALNRDAALADINRIRIIWPVDDILVYPYAYSAQAASPIPPVASVSSGLGIGRMRTDDVFSDVPVAATLDLKGGSEAA